MTQLQDLFLGQFEDRWRSPLLSFARRISDSNADILVFMARKAACLYHCLEDLKLAHTSAICTTDLTLEGDLSWMRGKRIDLIDDTLISGTSLHRATKKLSRSGVESLTTIAFCVDKSNWCRDLVTPSEPYLEADSHDVTSFSAQAIRAIGVIPRPYLIDFPLYGFIRLPGYSLDRVLSMTGWELDEVTSTSQRSGGAATITMIPLPSIIRRLDQQLGWKCSELAQLAKVRLYARRRGGRGENCVHFCRALPIVAFDPVTIVELQTLWQCFERNLGVHHSLIAAQLQTPKERLRLLQFYCASQLFRIWFESIREVCSPRSVTFEIDYRQIDFCFPPPIRDHIIALLKDESVQPFGGAPTLSLHNLPARPGLVTASRFKGTDLPGIQAKLTEPFESLFSQRELPARALVKAHGPRAFDLPEYKGLIDRLNHGISLPELRESLSCLRDHAAAKTFVSMFIDDAIDRGIAVPITVDDGRCVYRAFRHGEDVKFTDIEARLVCLMIAEVSQILELPLLPRLVVEKLIVLLIRGGLSRGFIERWMGNLGDRKAAGIRFYLQGAVAQLSPDRRPYHYSPGDSLTSLLKGWGFLSEPKKNEHYQISLPHRPPTTTSMEKDAKALGAAIGLALKGISAEQRNNELTLVATCLTPMDVAAALAAEIHYFYSHWETLSNGILPRFHPNKAEEVIRTHGVYVAVNSGLWKWRQYRQHVPVNVLAIWHDRLKNEPAAVFVDAILEGAFPVSDTTLISANLIELIEAEGAWIIRSNIHLRRLRVDLLEAYITMIGRLLIPFVSCEEILNAALREMRLIKEIASSRFQKQLSDGFTQLATILDCLSGCSTKADRERAELLRLLRNELHDNNHRLLSSPDSLDGKASEALLAAVSRVRKTTAAMLASTKKTRKVLIAQSEELDAEMPPRFKRFSLSGVQLDLPLEQGIITPMKNNQELEALGDLLPEGNAILDQVDAVVTPFGRPRNFSTYRHLLTLHVHRRENLDAITCDRLYNELRRIVIEAASSKNGADLHILTNSREIWLADFAIASGGKFSREWLSIAANSIVNVLRGVSACRICLWVDLEPDETIIRAENTSDALARNLTQRLPCLEDLLPSPQKLNHVVLMSSRGAVDVSGTGDEISKRLPDLLRSGAIREVTLAQPRPRKYFMDILEHHEQASDESVRTDIGIITIVPEEMNSVLHMLESSGKTTKNRRNGSVYYSGRMPAEGGNFHSVVATQQLEQGNRSVILAYERLCREYRPVVVVLLGIGGSIDPNVALCDVVIADQIIWYEQGTETEDGMNRKGEAAKLTAWLRTLLNDFFAQNGYPYSIPSDTNRSPAARAHLGPIGSGEKVIRFRDSSIRQWLSEFNYKCIALETEAGGLAQAFYEEPATMAYGAGGYMVIRGISDHADKDKDDKCRLAAAQNACLVLKNFLITVPPFATYVSETIQPARL